MDFIKLMADREGTEAAAKDAFVSALEAHYAKTGRAFGISIEDIAYAIYRLQQEVAAL